MSESHSPDYDDNPEVVHEESDVNVGSILRYGLALAVVAAIVHVFLFWLVGVYERQYQRTQTQVYPMAAGQQDRLPPEPRLQDDPQEDLRTLRSRQDTQLHEYGWVNKEAGIARIPIEEAMRIVVQRGLPARQETQK
jgi:hypothetical protein